MMTSGTSYEAFQREVCSWIAIPDGVAAITDYRRGGSELDAGQDHLLRHRRRRSDSRETPMGWYADWSSTAMASRMRACGRDFSWSFTPIIVEWKRGEFDDELVEVSHAQASKIIEYFRGKWGPFGQPVDS